MASKLTLTENRGYAWFPFDAYNWLTSSDVMSMSAAEEGIYIRCLAAQWRDGNLHRGSKLLAQQIGRDHRSVNRFLAKWAHLFYTAQPDGTLKAQTAAEWKEYEQDGTNWSGTARNAATASRMANPKLFFLSVKQGKSELPAGQNKRDLNGYLDTEPEQKQVGKGGGAAPQPSGDKVRAGRKMFEVEEDEL